MVCLVRGAILVSGRAAEFRYESALGHLQLSNTSCCTQKSVRNSRVQCTTRGAALCDCV